MFHIEQKSIKGNPAYQLSYENGKFYSSTAKNRDPFKANPEKYAPAYGGFRSYGVRVGKKFDGDPNIWKIVGGTLYLQLDQGTNAICSKDLKKNIAIADRL